ncbi:MAG: hypothetical protein INQ03_19920 [Candidatus Heimdallarchaeota archaeon]|nr:hypothetical protein [Candidatus Heimdallarchaeota archaeon]
MGIDSILIMLKLMDIYSREDVAKIFEPNYIFKASTGSWGGQGIVRLKISCGYVFFVTLDKSDSEYK